MSNAIGLRFYRVTFHEIRSSDPLENDDSRLFKNQTHLLNEFVTRHMQVTTIEDAQRGWFFDSPDQSRPRKVSGMITYGIHGIVSRFVDVVSRKEEFQRKNNHLEEIPLFFYFYRPKNEKYLIFAFQSFGVRSCVTLVQVAFKNYIEGQSDLTVRFRKLMPAEAGVDPFAGGVVKEVRLLKRRQSGDRVDSYLQDGPVEYDLTVSLSARGRNNFGVLRELTPEKIRKLGYSVAVVDEFDKASAKVTLDGTSKRVTVFGERGEAGVIDLSDDEDLVISNGHPTQESMEKIVKPLMRHFHNALMGYRK